MSGSVGTELEYVCQGTTIINTKV